MFCKFYSDVSKAAPDINRFFNFYRFYRTHYDVLNLPSNCTAKEIKSAFIKLSKEYHPDVNKNEGSHANFQKINDAYKVLGKPETRREYDLGLIQSDEQSHNRRHYYTHTDAGRNPYHDPTFWANRNKFEDEYYKNRSYYGINGVPRLPNGAIMMFCILFAIVGVGIQFLAISHSMTFKREALIRQSLEAQHMLKTAQDAASSNGNEAQIEALRLKLLRNQKQEPDDK